MLGLVGQKSRYGCEGGRSGDVWIRKDEFFCEEDEAKGKKGKEEKEELRSKLINCYSQKNYWRSSER